MLIFFFIELKNDRAREQQKLRKCNKPNIERKPLDNHYHHKNTS